MSDTMINLPKGGGGIKTLNSDTPGVTVTGDQNKVIHIDPSSWIAAESHKVTNTFTAGEDLSAMRVVFMDEDAPDVLRASHDDFVKSQALGITLHAAMAGQPVEVLQFGILQDATLMFEARALLFVGLNGVITETAPSTGYLCRIGKQIYPGTILVEIETVIAL